MPYDSLISRTDASALVPDEVATEILGLVPEQSAAVSLFRNIRMSSKVRTQPVLSALPTAYWVNGDTGLKQTTEVNWDGVSITAEEIACIVPIPEAVLEDADYDIWGEVRPLAAEAIGRTFDAAVFFGTNKPASFPASLVAGAAANTPALTVTRGTATAAAGGVAGDITTLMGKIEAAGYDVNGWVANRSLRGSLRGARDTTGQKLADVNIAEIEGTPIRYAMSGLWPTSSGTVEAFAGDFTQGVVGIRKDITYKILTEAVIQDGSGNIVYNLAQQDMVALRLVFRAGFAVPNPIRHEQETAANRYPFGTLLRP